MAKKKKSRRLFTDYVSSLEDLLMKELREGSELYEVTLVRKFKLKYDAVGSVIVPKEKK